MMCNRHDFELSGKFELTVNALKSVYKKKKMKNDYF